MNLSFGDLIEQIDKLKSNESEEEKDDEGNDQSNNDWWGIAYHTQGSNRVEEVSQVACEKNVPNSLGNY